MAVFCKRDIVQIYFYFRDIIFVSLYSHPTSEFSDSFDESFAEIYNTWNVTYKENEMHGSKCITSPVLSSSEYLLNYWLYIYENPFLASTSLQSIV